MQCKRPGQIKYSKECYEKGKSEVMKQVSGKSGGIYFWKSLRGDQTYQE